MQYVEIRNFYVKMGFFWAFSENGTPAIYFFKKKFEMFSLVLFWNCECVVCKNGLFVKCLRTVENQKCLVEAHPVSF